MEIQSVLIVSREFDGHIQTKNICIDEDLFWIRVHDLPLMAQNEYVSKLIGGALGQLEEIDLVYGEFEWGEFMRLRVSIDITRPLLQ